MRILGLSFGRKNGTCDAALKLALKGVLAADTSGSNEVRFINTCNLKIDRCTGCGACDKIRERGGMSICVHKDDFQFLEDEIMEADAIIAACPVYVLGPTGQYKNLADRIGPSHGIVELTMENERRKKEGWSEDKMIPSKYFKRRPIAYISIGGARTVGWTSMGLPGMYLLGFPQHMVPVDALNIYGMGDMTNPVMNDELAARLSQMGRNVTEAAAKKPEEMEWKGDEEGVCPICHCNQLTVRDGDTVECTVCGSIGKLSVEDGRIRVRYPKEQLLRSRFRYGGDLEHILEIHDMQDKGMKRYPLIADELKARLKKLDEDVAGMTVVKPSSAKARV